MNRNPYRFELRAVGHNEGGGLRWTGDERPMDVVKWIRRIAPREVRAERAAELLSISTRTKSHA